MNPASHCGTCNVKVSAAVARRSVDRISKALSQTQIGNLPTWLCAACATAIITRLAPQKAARRGKYNACPVTVDGIRFDSKREAARWATLQTMLARGEIASLERQPKFPLEINGVRVATYIADFRYNLGPEVVIEDVKSPATRANRVYRLKKKIVEALYGIEIKEV